MPCRWYLHHVAEPEEDASRCRMSCCLHARRSVTSRRPTLSGTGSSSEDPASERLSSRPQIFRTVRGEQTVLRPGAGLLRSSFQIFDLVGEYHLPCYHLIIFALAEERGFEPPRLMPTDGLANRSLTIRVTPPKRRDFSQHGAHR